MSDEAFSGLRVLDLSERLSGAFAARLFGDFGADVLLAEPPEGHTLRGEPPFASQSAPSPLHVYVNWNKRSIPYPSGRELEDLVRTADVVVTTDLETATRITEWLRVDAIQLCITAHGSRGALSKVPGNNLTTSARTGWSYINRLREEPPLQMPRHQSGYVGGMAGYIAAAAALSRRDAERRAERVDVSELEAFAHTVHPWGIMSIYAGQEDAHGPSGWRRRGRPGPLWEVGGGRMHLAIADFHNWTAAMDALGLPDVGRDETLIPDRGRHGRDLRAVVAALGEALPQRNRWQVFHDLASLRCVVGVVQDIDDLLGDAQFAARQYLTRTTVAEREVRAAGAPFKLSPAPWRLQRSAPSEPATQPATFLASQAATPTTTHNTTPAGQSAKRAGPLSGLRVLSLGQAWSGTFGTEILALLGADVVQVGALQRPDVWRRVRNDVPPGVRNEAIDQHPLNTSSLYNAVNLNKRELTLNLKDPRGMQLFWQLIGNFDVLLDNFRASVMPSWGITLDKLHDRRPGIIWASISGYGTEGPYSNYPANGASTEPMSGLSSLHGYAGDPGMNTAGLFPDPVSGYTVAAGIMAALHHRNRTGAPQRVDVAMMEAVTTLCGDAVIEYELTGQLPRPLGNRHPRHAPHNHYPCADDNWLALAVETPAHWQAVARIVGGMLQAPAWQLLSHRRANEDSLDTLIAEWTAERRADELESIFCEAGVPAARVMPLFELYTSTSTPLYESGFIRQIHHPEAGPSLLPTYPWHFSTSDEPDLRPSPCVGEHSREILGEELGIDPHTYQELVKAGITGTLEESASA